MNSQYVTHEVACARQEMLYSKMLYSELVYRKMLDRELLYRIMLCKRCRCVVMIVSSENKYTSRFTNTQYVKHEVARARVPRARRPLPLLPQTTVIFFEFRWPIMHLCKIVLYSKVDRKCYTRNAVQ